MTSAVMIVPAAMLPAADAFGIAQGWGAGNFSVPLTDAQGGVFWACRAEVGPAFEAMVQDPPAEAAPLLQAMVLDLRETDDPYQHFAETIAQAGLSRVPDPQP